MSDSYLTATAAKRTKAGNILKDNTHVVDFVRIGMVWACLIDIFMDKRDEGMPIDRLKPLCGEFKKYIIIGFSSTDPTTYLERRKFDNLAIR